MVAVTGRGQRRLMHKRVRAIGTHHVGGMALCVIHHGEVHLKDGPLQTTLRLPVRVVSPLNAAGLRVGVMASDMGQFLARTLAADKVYFSVALRLLAGRLAP